MTQEYLKSLLYYNPETGKFTWRVSKNNRVKCGSEAGTIQSSGHRRIRIDKKDYLAHRLVWLWYYGRWPENEIDHINKPDDNRLKNLRGIS